MRSRLRLRQDGDLLKGQRLDSYLFPEFAHERVSRRFAAVAVPSDDVPHTRVEGPTLRALCQKNLVATNQKTTGTDPHRVPRGKCVGTDTSYALAELRAPKATGSSSGLLDGLVVMRATSCPMYGSRERSRQSSFR